MKRALSPALAGALLLGCRAVIGISDLTLDDGGADASTGEASSSPDSSDDSSLQDVTSAFDSSPPETRDTGAADATPPPPDAPTGGTTCTGPCNQCMGACRNAAGGAVVQTQVTDMVNASCLCGPGGCGTACAGTVCGPPGGPPPVACAICMDGLIKSGSSSCAAALAQCRSDSPCAAMLACMDRCHS